MPSKVKLEKIGDPDAQRITCDDEILGFALKFSNGTWGAFNPDQDQRLTGEAFKTPARVWKWFDEKLEAEQSCGPEVG